MRVIAVEGAIAELISWLLAMVLLDLIFKMRVSMRLKLIRDKSRFECANARHDRRTMEFVGFCIGMKWWISIGQQSDVSCK